MAGSHAYVAVSPTIGFKGLEVVDISNPVSPSIVGSVGTPGAPVGIATSGSLAYVVEQTTVLQLVDVSDPSSPVIVGSVNTLNSAADVAVMGSYAYVTDSASGVQVVDVSNASSPVIVASVDTPGYASGIALAGHHAFVADDESGLQVIDISNPLSPTIIGSVDTPAFAASVDIDGPLAYVADGLSGLQVVNISNPSSPKIVGAVITPGDPQSVDATGYALAVAVAGSHVYVGVQGGDLTVVPSQCVHTSDALARPLGGPFVLGPVLPFPARQSATVTFSMPHREAVRLEVFDVRGRRLRQLFSGDLRAGDHSVTWDGRNDDGHRLGSGLYFVRLSWAGGSTTTRAALLR